MGGNALKSCCGKNHMYSMYEITDLPTTQKKSKRITIGRFVEDEEEEQQQDGGNGGGEQGVVKSNDGGIKNSYSDYNEQQQQPYIDMAEVVREKQKAR